MLVTRGKSTYAYRTERVNGKPVTRYIGKSSSPQAKEYAKRKEEKKQHRNRDQELERLNQELECAIKLIKIMERGYLLVAGFYERKSEIRKLQEEHYAS